MARRDAPLSRSHFRGEGKVRAGLLSNGIPGAIFALGRSACNGFPISCDHLDLGLDPGRVTVPWERAVAESLAWTRPRATACSTTGARRPWTTHSTAARRAGTAVGDGSTRVRSPPCARAAPASSAASWSRSRTRARRASRSHGRCRPDPASSRRAQHASPPRAACRAPGGHAPPRPPRHGCGRPGATRTRRRRVTRPPRCSRGSPAQTRRHQPPPRHRPAPAMPQRLDATPCAGAAGCCRRG